MTSVFGGWMTSFRHVRARIESVSSGLSRVSTSALLTLFALTVVAAILGASYAYYRQIESNLAAHLDRELSNLAQVLAEDLSDDLGDVAVVLRNVAQAAAREGLPKDQLRRDALRASLNDQIRGTGQVRALAVFDPRGQPVIHTAGELKQPVNIADRDYFIAQLRTEKPDVFIGTPIVSRITHRWSLPVSFPIRDQQGRIAGVVAAVFESEHSERTYRSLRLGEGAGVFVVHTSGLVVAGSASERGLPGKTFAHRPGFATIASGPAGVLHGSSLILDEPAVIAYRRVTAAPLVLLISLREDVALAPLAQQRTQIAAISLVAAIVVLLFAGLLARQLWQRECAEAALRERQQELVHAQRVGNLGSWNVDMRTDSVTLSEQARRILELPPEASFSSRSEAYDIIVHPDDRAHAEQGFRHALEGGQTEAERRIRTPAGKTKWIRSFAEASLDAKGKPLVLRGTIQEITDVKEAQLRLAESERAYRLLSENTRDLVSLHDVRGTLLFVSNSVSRILGYAPSDLLGKNIYDYIHPADATLMHDEVDSLAGSERVELHVEFRFRTMSGSYIWLECLAVSVHGADGRIEHIQASSRDITPRREALEALRASEERFRRLTEFTSDWYWETDCEYRFTLVSAEHNQLLAKVRPLLLGKSPWESPYNRASEQVWTAHKTAIAARQPFRDLIIEFIDPGTGAVLEYQSIGGEPFFAENGAFQGYRGTGRYITQQKRYELALANRTAELAESNAKLNDEARRRRELERNVLLAIEKELGRVGLELHDDLGQNLTGIALLAKALQNKLSQANFDESLEAARILALVNDTIRQARLVSHGLSPHIVGPEGLTNALQQLADDVNSLGTTSCRFACDPGVRISDHLVARGLYRIAQEAVNNALKHSHAKSIEIELGKVGNETRLAVLDNGIGIVTARDGGSGEPALHSIRYRARVINATLKVARRETGGTEIAVTLPAESHARPREPLDVSGE
jgi:PAS domain S-box-containing protein